MSIKRDLLKEKLLNSKSFNTIFLIKEDEEKVRLEQMEILIELLCDDKHKAGKSEVYNFLKKEKKAVDLLIKAISEATSDKKKLLEACWEANLDCTRHLALFTDIILTDKLEVAIEAFTTIENMQHILPAEAEKSLERIKEAMPRQTDSTKAALIAELTELLRKNTGESKLI